MIGEYLLCTNLSAVLKEPLNLFVNSYPVSKNGPGRFSSQSQRGMRYMGTLNKIPGMNWYRLNLESLVGQDEVCACGDAEQGATTRNSYLCPWMDCMQKMQEQFSAYSKELQSLPLPAFAHGCAYATRGQEARSCHAPHLRPCRRRSYVPPQAYQRQLRYAFAFYRITAD